jgi:DNA repair exonuclease SbcCD ATPase subunit
MAQMETRNTQTTSNGSDQNQESESMTVPNLADAETSYNVLTNLNLILLIIAGIIALAIGVVSFLSNRASAALIRSKDQQIAHDLKEKDDQISETNKEAKRIESAANEKIAILNTRAESLKAEAAKAREGIETAKADAARAKEGIANAEAQSAKATVEVTRLQSVVANAERERAVAQRALLELQERLKHRLASPEQAKNFVAELKKLPKQTIDLGFIGGPADDSFDFTVQLLGLFKEAGWTVRNERNIEHFMDLQFAGIGLFINGPQAEPGTRIPVETTPIMVVLQAAFKTLGMDLEFVNWPPQDKEFVRVVVGTKLVR